MGKEKTSDNNNTGMRGIAPKKRFWSTALLLVTAILSLISLFDYDPANLHNYPPAGSPPVFGQVGLFLGRSLLCFFGLSAWLIPWAAFSFAFMCWQQTPSRERFQKILPLSLVGLGVVLLGSIRDTHLFTEGLPPAFDQNFFENGAGGIMGSWLYSGLVITMPISLENGGYLFVWLGEVGTTVIACISLFAGCTLFFSLKNETSSRIFKPLIFSVRAFFGRSFFKFLSKLNS